MGSQPVDNGNPALLNQMATQLYWNVMKHNMERLMGQQQNATASQTTPVSMPPPTLAPTQTPIATPAQPSASTSSQKNNGAEVSDDEWLECWGPRPGTKEYIEQYGEEDEKTKTAKEPDPGPQ